MKQLRKEIRDRDEEHRRVNLLRDTQFEELRRVNEEHRRVEMELRTLLAQRVEPAGPSHTPGLRDQITLPVPAPAAPQSALQAAMPIVAPAAQQTALPMDRQFAAWPVSAPPASTIATWAGPPAYLQRPAAPPAPPTVHFGPAPSPYERVPCGNFSPEEAAQRTSQWVNAIDANAPAANWLPSLLNSVTPPQEQGIRSVAMFNRTSKAYELEPFSGNPAEWLAFEAQYYKGTEECQYSEMDNHARLGRCLRGWAYDLVKDVLIGQVGRAEDMMQTLRESCGHPIMVTEAALKGIAAFRPLPAKANLAQVLDLAILVRNTASMLSSYPALRMDRGALLMDFVDKLPDTYRVMWLTHVDTRLADKPVIQLEDLSDWLKRLRDAGAKGGFRPCDLPHTMSYKRATTLATTVQEEPQSSAPYRGPQVPAPYHEPQSSAPYRKPQAPAPDPRHQWEPQASPPQSVTPQQGQGKRPPNINTCWDCGDHHPIDRCNTFRKRKPSQKKQLVMDRGLCFICLRTGHRSQTCQAPKCSKCKGAHHRALHSSGGYASA